MSQKFMVDILQTYFFVQTTYYGVPVHLVREVWLAMLVRALGSLCFYSANSYFFLFGPAVEKAVVAVFQIPVHDCKN